MLEPIAYERVFLYACFVLLLQIGHRKQKINRKNAKKAKNGTIFSYIINCREMFNI